MMIDTTTRENFERTLCACFHTDKVSLLEKLNCLEVESSGNLGIDWNTYDEEIEKFILNSTHKKIEKLQFFHLARRLSDSPDNTTDNLLALLTKSSPISEFLAKHQLRFIDTKKGYIELYDNSKLIDFSDSSAFHENSYYYLKSRLGYNKNHPDFCVNGFSFMYNIRECDYFQTLSQAPEFIQMLAEHLNKDKLVENYLNNSSYKCIQYNFPIDMIIFDGYDQYENKEKELLFLRKALILFSDKNSENVILRLDDNSTASSKFFVSSSIMNNG